MNTRMRVRRRLGVAATAAAAAVLPFQAGVAHAGTPDDDLSACITSAVANMSPTFTTDVDACVNAYLVELGIDPATMTFDTTVAVPDGSSDATVDTSGNDVVNNDIGGTVTSDASAGTADS